MHHGVRQSVVAVLVLLFSSGVICARLPGEYLTTIRPDRLKTVCRPFAADYAKGPLKVLFLTQARMAPREVVELKQRFALDMDAVLYESPPGQVGLIATEDIWNAAVENTSAAEKTARLARLLEQRWDAIVVGYATSLRTLPPKIQYTIAKQVSEGTGLLAIGEIRQEMLTNPTSADAPEGILHGIPFPLMTSYTNVTTTSLETMPAELLKTYTFGKGRIATLKHLSAGGVEGYWQGFNALTPGIPHTYKEDLYYDYSLSVIAKTLLWVVPSKASAITPILGNPASSTTRWSDLPQTISIGTFRIPSGMKLECQLEVRDLFGGVISLPAQKLTSGNIAVSVTLPQLPQGDYFIDYRLTSSKGTEYWGSYGLAVRMAPTAIQSITFDKPMFTRTELLRATLHLTQPVATNLTVRVEGIDLYGRRVFGKRIPATIPDLGMEAELTRCLAIPHHLRVELMDGERCLNVAREDFLVARPEAPFYTLCWGLGEKTFVGQILANQIRNAGFNLALGSDPESSARQDLALFQYTTHLRPPTPSTNSPDCGWSNPEWTTTFVTNVQAGVRKWLPYANNIIYYSMGDENGYSYSRETNAPSEVKAFRQYLKDAYAGDISTLNREWGSSFPRFGDIPPVDVQKPMTMVDIPRKNLWMDFCEKVYADAFHVVGQGIKQVDSKARVGAEGSTPGNLELTIDGLEMWGPYPSRLDNVLMRSFGRPDLFRGNWWGGYVASRKGKAQPYWDQILSGGVNSCFYFAVSGPEGFLSGDLSFADYYENEQMPAIKEVAGSIGPLLNRTAVATMGLGLFYSLPSEHAGTIDTRFGTPGACRDGLLKFCEDTGISGYFYSERQIQGGKLEKDGVKLLFMPQALCFSDATAEALKTWVVNGGVLVADQQVGLRNERGAPRPKGVLDDLFGVRQDSIGEAVSTNCVGNLLGVSVEWDRVLVDGKVTTTNKPALLAGGKVPVVIPNTVGKGRTLFLNLAMGKVLARYANADGTRAFLLTMLDQAGIFTKLHAPAGYLVTRFQSDGYELISCRVTTDAQAGAELGLGRSYYVYDVRSGKYLGPITEIAPTDKNNLYALLPAKVAEFDVTCPPAITAGELAEVRITQRSDKNRCMPDRLYRTSVLSPGGKELELMRCFVAGKDKPAIANLPFALNTPEGTYTLVVTDLLTGNKRTSALKVKGVEP